MSLTLDVESTWMFPNGATAVAVYVPAVLGIETSIVAASVPPAGILKGPVIVTTFPETVAVAARPATFADEFTYEVPAGLDGMVILYESTYPVALPVFEIVAVYVVVPPVVARGDPDGENVLGLAVSERVNVLADDDAGNVKDDPAAISVCFTCVPLAMYCTGKMVDALVA